MSATPALAPAASVLLLRGDEPELFLVRRSPRLRFLGGFHAFPGGKVDAADDDGQHPPALFAAVRELFEETGVLLASQADGTLPATSETLSGWRRDLLASTRSFAELLAALRLELRPELLDSVGNLATPEFSPHRYDTTFLVADLPAGQTAEVWPGELESGAWMTAQAALDTWRRGEILLSPPTVALLLAVANQPRNAFRAAARTAITRVEAREMPPLWFSPGVQMIPLRTPALPPAAYTNAFLVGTGPRYLLDPGATEPDEQAKLFRLLDAEREPLTAVLLTHHHIDHVGAAEAVARRYRVPVWAHADAANLLEGQVEIDRHLEDGCRLSLGESPRGGPWEMIGLLMPGHAPGHLVFHLPDYGLLLAGDIVSTLSSVLVAPPDGNLREYLASVRRLQTLDLRLLLPAHGGPSSRPARLLQDTLEHRQLRERMLLDALGQGMQFLADLVPEVYRGVPPDLWSLAELQLLGNLLKLRDEGIVVCAGADEKGPWLLR